MGIKTGLTLADAVKVRREEWRPATGADDLDRGAAILPRAEAEAILTTA